MGHRTPLYDTHVKLGARMVDFGGWDMPLHYGSQIEEHHTVRGDAGIFDVSHMNVIDLKGVAVREFLRLLVANDVDKLKAKGKALYTCMLNQNGGVIDDLIVYYLDDQWYRIVSNAGTREKDMAWIRSVAERFGEVKVTQRDDRAMIAVQGPQAKEKAYHAFGESLRTAAGALKPFHSVTVGELFVATTGYTGEEGFEIVLPARTAESAWQALLDAGVKPAGLGARDTLRLEAGMNLYGQDMDESTTPLETGLAWTVDLKSPRDFIGKSALMNALPAQRALGLILLDKGVMRSHQAVRTAQGNGVITSGGFGP